MKTHPGLHDDLVVRMRQQGAQLSDEGFIEDNLMDASVRWANAFTLDILGYTPEEFAELGVIDLIPDFLGEELNARIGGKRSKYFVIALKTAQEKLSWWLAHDVGEEYPLHWARARYLMTTEPEGDLFTLMRIVLEVGNVSGELHHVHEQVEEWIRSEIMRLDASDKALRVDFSNLSQKVSASISIAKQAVDLGMQTGQEVRKLGETLDGLELRVSTEIMRLIGQDAAYDSRLEHFRKQLADEAKRASATIEASAQTAGKTVGKKVAMPVGVLGACLVIVDHLLQHPEILGKIVMHFFG